MISSAVAWALVPVLLSLLVRLTAPALVRQCTPAWAARGLVLLSLAAAGGTLLGLCTVAGLGVAEIGTVARIGRWSADAISDRTPVPGAVGLVATVVAALLVARGLRHLALTLGNGARAVRFGRALTPDAAGVVVVEEADVAAAYSVPGRPGRIVMTRGLLQLLDRDEQEAVLAHERAHLRHRHVVYVQLAELAAAVDPLLRPSVRCVRQAVEAWADDAAVRAVGDPVCVAQALAKVALAGHGRTPALALPAADSDVALRVRNLMEPGRRRTGRWLAAVAVIAALCAGSTGVLGLRAHGNFEIGQASYQHHH